MIKLMGKKINIELYTENFCLSKPVHYSTKTYVVGTEMNRLNEMVLISTQNICCTDDQENNNNCTP